VTPDEAIALAEAFAGAVKAAYDAYEGAKSGKISATDATNALNAFQSSLATDNAAADSALDAKFKGA